MIGYFLYGIRWALPVAPIAIVIGGFIDFLRQRKEIRHPKENRMNITDWTVAIHHYLQSLDQAVFELERMQHKLMLGSLLTVMEREMSYPISLCACSMNGLSVDDAEEYKALFADLCVAKVKAA